MIDFHRVSRRGVVLGCVSLEAPSSRRGSVDVMFRLNKGLMEGLDVSVNIIGPLCGQIAPICFGTPELTTENMLRGGGVHHSISL